MIVDLTYWYLFPIGLVIAVLSMSAGISGANFWIPVYLFLLEIDAGIVFWLALITTIFGFGSGAARNISQGTVNWYLVKMYLIPIIPATITGSLLASYVDHQVLIFIFGSFIFVYGIYLFVISVAGSGKSEVRHNRILWEIGFIAGLLKGLIATGTGKLIVPGMWNHEKIRRPSEVIGTAVVIMFITDITAALTRMNPAFVSGLVENSAILVNVLIFVIPSVIIGGQVAPLMVRSADVRRLKIFISLTLVFVSILIFSRLAV